MMINKILKLSFCFLIFSCGPTIYINHGIMKNSSCHLMVGKYTGLNSSWVILEKKKDSLYVEAYEIVKGSMAPRLKNWRDFPIKKAIIEISDSISMKKYFQIGGNINNPQILIKRGFLGPTKYDLSCMESLPMEYHVVKNRADLFSGRWYFDDINEKDYDRISYYDKEIRKTNFWELKDSLPHEEFHKRYSTFLFELNKKYDTQNDK